MPNSVSNYTWSTTSRWLALFWLVLAVRPCWAAPEVNYFYPPGGQRGQTVEVTAAGKFPAWPAKCWVDRPGLEATAQEKNGVLSVHIASDAAPDVYWIRLVDESGAATPQPFVVGLVPERGEAEPNDALDTAQPIDIGDAPQRAVVVNGRLNKGGDVDLYRVSVEAGQTLVADLDAQAQLDSPVDASLQVVSADGFVLAQNDDQLGLDPRLAVTIPQTGQWLVRVFGFPAVANQSISLAGSDSFVYRLTLCTGPVVDYSLPLALSREGTQKLELRGWNLPPEMSQLNVAPQESGLHLLEQPGIANVLRLPVVDGVNIVAVAEQAPTAASSANWPVSLPFTATGRIDERRQRDVYRFAAKQGEIVVAKVESRALGFDLDPVLELLDAGGKQLAKLDDTGASRDAELAQTAAADGDLQLAVSDLHAGAGPRYVYRLSVQRGRPDFALSLDAHQLVVATGATVELPVNIERRHGLADPIAITVEGLPTGVQVEEVSSQGTDDSAKKVTLKLTADASAAQASVPVRVVGRVGEGAPQASTIAAGTHGQQPLELWLTVAAAEAKQ